MEPIAEMEFEDDTERLRRVQSIYSLRRESQESGESDGSASKKWFNCGRRSLRGRRTVSEASVYRTSSKYSLKSVGPTTKTLDCLMQCFWLCSPGCQQTA